jgi:UDP-glucose 4-epimerase
MNILITGVSGYIGSHAAEVFLANNYRVYGIDINRNNALEKLNGNFEFFQGNICDYSFILKLFKDFKKQGDFVVLHFAGLKNARESFTKSSDYFEINLGGTEILLKSMLALDLKYLIFASSCSVYGEGSQTFKVNESTPYRPISPYGKTKMYAEIAIENASKNSSIKAVSLRFFNVVGNSDFLSGDKAEFGLLPSLYKSIDHNLTFNVFGGTHETSDGTCMRDFVDVREIVETLPVLVTKMLNDERLESVYNLGSGKGHTVLQISELAQKLIDNKLCISLGKTMSGDPGSILADTSRALRDLGWIHKTPIEKSLLSSWKAWSRDRTQKDS